MQTDASFIFLSFCLFIFLWFFLSFFFSTDFLSISFFTVYMQCFGRYLFFISFSMLFILYFS